MSFLHGYFRWGFHHTENARRFIGGGLGYFLVETLWKIDHLYYKAVNIKFINNKNSYLQISFYDIK